MLVDILEEYFTGHVKKSTDAVDDFLAQKCEYMITHGERARAKTLLDRIIGFSKMRLPVLSDMMGRVLAEDGLFSKAYIYFFKSKNEVQIVRCLREIAPRGYYGERHLFWCRCTLDMLARSPDVNKAKYIHSEW